MHVPWIHNLTYLTWVEQQGTSVEELDVQWDEPAYWTSTYRGWHELDDRIRTFNERTGVVQRCR